MPNSPCVTGAPRWALGVLCLAWLTVHAPDAAAQTVDNLLLVINSKSPESVQIGEYYARKRGVPAERIVRLQVEPSEQISRTAFDSAIEGPLAAFFTQRGLQDRILYLVLTKGVPLRIAGSPGRTGTIASVDSELTLLYRRLTGKAAPPQGFTPNPYFLAERPVKEASRFTHQQFDIFLVTRLDGFTVRDVTALIDRGLAPSKSGRIALDEKGSLVNTVGNRWLERGADLLRGMGLGDRVLLESTSQPLSGQRGLLGYYSWGSNDPNIKNRDQNLGFEPGALAGSFVSTDGRTFTEPPATWTLGNWEDARTFFGGSPQSLTGDLIRQGVTGASGHVAEPFLDATVRPDVLFPAYLSGFNLAEAFYLGMPYLSWQTVVIGDPLVSPFAREALTAQQIDPGTDAGTSLPGFFSAKAEQAMAAMVPIRAAARALLRGQTMLARSDRDGAREAFEEATLADPRLVQAHVLLANIFDEAGEPDKAIARYRSALAVMPTHAPALNNLAYALATHHKDTSLQEALTLARKANALAPNNPSILDTLAWVMHIAGDDRGAVAPSDTATKLAPNDATVILHAAVIEAGAGSLDSARRRLARALELNPALAKEAEVRQLQAKLGEPVKP